MTTQKREIVKRYKAEEIDRYLAEWKESGKSQIAFSKEKGINYFTLNKWINDRKSKVKRQEATSGGFAQLAVSPVSSIGLFAEIKKEGITILLHQAVNADFLRALIK